VYVYVTQATTIAAIPAAAGLVLQIPEQYYNSGVMTRLGVAAPSASGQFFSANWPPGYAGALQTWAAFTGGGGSSNINTE
jgi:hypothetical protein